jgi:hypothetical protein
MPGKMSHDVQARQTCAGEKSAVMSAKEPLNLT